MLLNIFSSKCAKILLFHHILSNFTIPMAVLGDCIDKAVREAFHGISSNDSRLSGVAIGIQPFLAFMRCADRFEMPECFCYIVSGVPCEFLADVRPADCIDGIEQYRVRGR